MDAVITYVNDMEPIWRLSYIKEIGLSIPSNDIRFKDYGTLRFVLRGISEHMKFIDRVFLVVSNIEQVPDYVGDNVIVITHDMFIPKEYLPTFNSCTIECFLWNIPDLSEEFIYFNDDMIPINNLEKEDFFENGLPCLYFRECKTSSALYNMSLLMINFYAAQTNTQKEKINYLWPLHIMTPYLKSDYYISYKEKEKIIKDTIAPIRLRKHFSQHFFSNSLYYKGKYIEKYLETEYITTNKTDNAFFTELNNNKNKKAICINDCGPFLNKTLSETIFIMNEYLHSLLPNKGKYEK